ncbi:MAG: exodeoxyribonuclease VII large subunit [candidate division Zixibacteria bacterium RBG_16_40_9]|nr:MAG: exodeoxyribonuclease VII large subunit [candidate division Zixibacteria bacterium RBG_16_40_9]
MQNLTEQIKIYTVSEINREIKTLVELNLPPIWIEGEISNYIHHTSGHRYFTLKDENAQIRSVLWRDIGDFLQFEIEDGMKVVIYGNISVYEKQGQYQLYVEDIVPAGLGKLELAFRQLKEKLFKEGLFDEAHKKPIPEFPQKIGIVTSPTGAAIRDLINVIQRRMPPVEIILNPVKVQGDGAVWEIAQAIADFNQFENLDVIIVGRGGGSLEDLWAFNEEIVARAIYASEIPIISAVGHEIDFTIADLVADLRVPTPSAAAELVVKDRREVLSQIRHTTQNLIDYQLSLITDDKIRVKAALESYGMKKPWDLLAQKAQRVDELLKNMGWWVNNSVRSSQKNLANLIGKLNALSPLAILKRGYGVCYKLPKFNLIKDASELELKDEVEVRLHKGKFQGKVEKIEESW